MDVLKFEKLSKFKNIIHGISTKEFGSMKNQDNSPKRKNIDSFSKSLGLDNVGKCMHQVHGSDVQIVTEKNRNEQLTADGMITDQKNISLCVLVADCLPILFYDVRKKVIGVGHGGRRSLQSGIIKHMLDKLNQEFGSSSSDLIVGIGPGIEEKCYEVDGKLLDLQKIAIDQLLESGLLRKNIESIDICTKCNSDTFYSYRLGDKTERFMASICLI